MSDEKTDSPKKLTREEHSAQILKELGKVSRHFDETLAEVKKDQNKTFAQKYGGSLLAALGPLLLVVVPYIVVASVRFDRVERSTHRMDKAISDLESAVKDHDLKDGHARMEERFQQLSRDLDRIEKAIQRLSDKVDERRDEQ